jgi:hypothetical protein
MKNVFPLSLLLTIVLILGACGASVKMLGSWMDNSMAGYSIDNVLVIGLSRKDIKRNLWENTFVELLAKKNVKAQASHNITDDQMIEPDRQSIIEALQKSGADTVLITRVIDSNTEIKTLPGFVNYQPLPVYSGMHDYYGFAYRSVYVPPIDISKTTAYLESNVYDIATEKLIWTAQSEAIDANLLKSDYAKIANLLLDDLRKKKLL